LNPAYKSGDIMIIEDHINLMNGNPLIGFNDETLGPRFVDMCDPYDPELIQHALKGRRWIPREGPHLGVYAAVTGPNLETRAEYRALQRLGADVVGMSTVPEVLVARHAGMRVLGLAVVTDMCLPNYLKPANIEEIIAVANAAEPQLRHLVKSVLMLDSVKAEIRSQPSEVSERSLRKKATHCDGCPYVFEDYDARYTVNGKTLCASCAGPLASPYSTK